MFTKQDSDTGTVWMHDNGMVWIRHYDSIRPFFQAYRSVKKPKLGQMPWCVDNRRIGTDRGFLTLDQAMQAAEACLN